MRRAAEYHNVMSDIEKDKKMSIWHKVKDKEDIELSEDKKTVEIMFMENYNGGNYVDVPVEWLLEVLKGLESGTHTNSPTEANPQA